MHGAAGGIETPTLRLAPPTIAVVSTGGEGSNLGQHH